MAFFLLAVVRLLVAYHPTLAFAPPTVTRTSTPQQQHVRRGSTTTGSSRTTTALQGMRRRDALDWLKRTLLGGAGVVASAVPPAVAADDDAVGKVVTLQINNLDGLEGQTGVVKIQLQPSWAPLGVQRFEVSLLQWLSFFPKRQNVLRPEGTAPGRKKCQRCGVCLVPTV